MNREKTQQIINQLVEDFRSRTRHARQYAPAKHQIATLTELDILDLMPEKFGHGDAKIVIEEAQNAGGKQVGGFNAYGEGDVTSSKASELYLAINEVEVVEPAISESVVNKVSSRPVDSNGKSLKRGMKVRVLDHTWFDSHVPGSYATLVNPVERDYRGVREAEIYAIYVNEMEDENFNPVFEYAIETTAGMFKPEHLEIVE